MRERWTSAWQAVLIVVIVAGSLCGAVAVGHYGARHGHGFDWALGAGAATAFGTVLLAGYTAWLATTTRREVQFAVQEQHTRDLPIVVVTAREITQVMIDPTIGQTIPALLVSVSNVGLAPALDLELTVYTINDPDTAVGAALIAVVAAGSDSVEHQISLRDIKEEIDAGELEVIDLGLSGSFIDRRRDSPRHAITHLTEIGIRDEQQAAAKIARVRAAPWLIQGASVEARQGETFTFHPQVGNNGLGEARNVRVEFLTDDGTLYSRVRVESLPPNSQRIIDVTFPWDHPSVDADIVWDDGTREDRRQRSNLRVEAQPPPPDPSSRPPVVRG